MDAYRLPIHLRKFHLKKLEETLKKIRKEEQGKKAASTTAKVPKFALKPRTIKGKSR
jgi:hypothetical protein